MKGGERFNVGRIGECAVVKYYVRKGYQILKRNWIVSGSKTICEIDLIVTKGRHLRFIEVKSYMSNTRLVGKITKRVSANQINKIKLGVKFFLYKYPKFYSSDLHIDVCFAKISIDKKHSSVIMISNADRYN